jgi:hypothetical protein
LKGSTSLRRFGRLRVNFSYGPVCGIRTQLATDNTQSEAVCLSIFPASFCHKPSFCPSLGILGFVGTVDAMSLSPRKVSYTTHYTEQF